MHLNDRDVEEILRLLQATNFDELRLETGSLKLVLRRSGAATRDPADEAGAAPRDAPPARPLAGCASSDPPPSAPAAHGDAGNAADSGLVDVRAPLLGTFYRAPKPGAAPFVEVGARVEPETIVCIVEVMKLMTSVPACVAGEVVEVLASDGELVEYGQTVVRIRPARA